MTRNLVFESGTSSLDYVQLGGLSKQCFVIPVPLKLKYPYFLAANSYSSLMNTRFDRQLDENIRSPNEHMSLRTVRFFLSLVVLCKIPVVLSQKIFDY